MLSQEDVQFFISMNDLIPENFARILHSGAVRVHKLLTNSNLRPVRIGTSERIHRSDVDEFVLKGYPSDCHFANIPPAKYLITVWCWN